MAKQWPKSLVPWKTLINIVALGLIAGLMAVLLIMYIPLSTLPS